MNGLTSSSSSPTTSTSGAGQLVVASPKSISPTPGFSLPRFFRKYLAVRNPPPQSNNNPPAPVPAPAIQSPVPPFHNNSIISTTTNGSGRSPSSSSSAELEQIFTYFDENGDGKISASELQTCLRTVGSCELSDEDAEKAVRSSDADGDGMLGFDDFAKLMENADDDDKLRELREAFGMYSEDIDHEGGGGGYITPRSLKKMLTRLGQSKTTISNCKAMISKFDLNGDGLLNFDEFRIMMR